MLVAVPDEELRREVQSKTLEALFEALFRVLKHATASGALMQAASGEPMSGPRLTVAPLCLAESGAWAPTSHACA